MILQGLSQSLSHITLFIGLTYSDTTNVFLVILVLYSCLAFCDNGFYCLSLAVGGTLYYQYTLWNHG